MKTNYEKIKSDLLDFGKRNKACAEEYKRLYNAESIEDVIEVVKDNFSWCAQYRDFVGVIIAHRELFGEHQIFVNQNIEIKEGAVYLCVSEGEVNVNSYGTSTINAASHGTSTINARSYGTSTINAASWGTSTINAKSWGTSTINAESLGASTLNAESWGTSTINAKSCGTSTINAESYNTSTINAESYNTSTINAESYDTSTINAESYGTSTINARSYGTSTINAESYDTSTMLIRTSTIECKVHDKSIARYVYDDRIVVADASIKIERAEE